MHGITERALVKRLLESKRARQVVSLYGSQLFYLVGGTVTSILNTRYLDPTSYGRYSFALSLTGFVLLFIDFGFYPSGARVLAVGEHRPTDRREIIGALMIIGALLASIGGLAIFIISFFTVSLFKSNIGSTLRLFSLLLGLSGLENMVESVCRGENRIGSLSLFRIGVKTFHILLILAFVLAGTYGFTISLMVNLVSILAAAILLIFSVKPLFSGFRKSLTKVMRDVRSFGWNTYLGSIASSASYRTDSLMISAFSTEAAVGFYNLGNLLTLPMVSFSRALTTTLFKDFAQQNRIPRQVLQVNFLWLALSASGLTILRKLFIHLMFGRKYEPVIELVFPLAAAAVCAGLALPYNMFLAAKGMGQYIRNISFIVTGANIGLNILLIPRYGSLGASYASLLAMATNLTLFLFFYRRTLLRVREKGLGTDSTTRDQ